MIRCNTESRTVEQKFCQWRIQKVKNKPVTDSTHTPSVINRNHSNRTTAMADEENLNYQIIHLLVVGNLKSEEYHKADYVVKVGNIAILFCVYL
jgi:hypothetical protein